MLPEIEGFQIPSAQRNSLVFEKVLQYYDGPRLVLQGSRAGQLFLGWWSDSDERTERWVFLPLSEPRLREILSGRLSSLEGLSNAEDGYLLVADVDSDSGAVVRTIMTEAGALPPDSLPLEGARLNIPVPEEVGRNHRPPPPTGSEPVHPGEHLAEIMEELGITGYRLAKAIGTPQIRINDIVHCRRSITADTALRIGQALGMAPEFWLNLQRTYDLEVARAKTDVSGIEPLVEAPA